MMNKTVTKREELLALTNELAVAYNTHDVEAVVRLFASDGIFNNMDGKQYEGHAAIREATKKILSVGKLQFVERDTIVDEKTGKVMLHWILTITTDHGSTSGLGTDILHWKDGQLALKSTFFKTKMPAVTYETKSILKKLRLQLHYLSKS